MTMASAKANNYLKALDSARCNGEWSEVPELARKVQKHAPGRRCLCVTAVTEHHIHLETLAQPNTSSPELQKIFADLLVPIVDELSRHNLPLPKLPSPSGGGQRADVTPEDIFQAKVTIAWIYFLMGDHHHVLEKLPSEEEAPKLTGAEHAGNEYTRVAILKAIVLRGLATEFSSTSDQARALQVYKSAANIPAPSIGLYTEWRVWNEKALGRFALVAHKCWLQDEDKATELANKRMSKLSLQQYEVPEDDPEEVGVALSGATVTDAVVLFAFRSYHKHINAIQGYPTTPVKDRERGEVYKYYIRYLFSLISSQYSYRFDNSQQLASRASHQSFPSLNANRGSRSSGTIGVVGGGLVGGIGVTKDELKDEIRSIQEVYETYLMESVDFPEADEVHVEVLDWVDDVLSNWKNMGATPEDGKVVIEILYRACGKTFQSPRILRHLFTTLTATGNFHDAVLSFNTYLELVARAKDRISKGGHEKDFDDDGTIFNTVVEGIRILTKYYNNGKRAMEVAEAIEKWIIGWKVVCELDEEEEVKDKDELDLELVNPMEQDKKALQSYVEPEVLATAWRGVAIANACWARQTVEAAKRPEIQETAEDAFKRALRYDPEDIESLFGLGMILAETRHIEEATEAVKRGLMVLNKLKTDVDEYADGPEEERAIGREYMRMVVPFWHLLALLLSAGEEIDGALRVCDAVFEELGGESELLKRGYGNSNSIVEKGDTIREMIMQMGQDEKENILEVKMTQMALVELLEGPDSAVNMSDELFALYASLFDASSVQDQLVKSQQEKQKQQEALTVDDSATIKARPMSRYSRFGRSQPKNTPSTATAARPSTSASTIVARPKSSHTIAPKIQITDTNGGDNGSNSSIQARAHEDGGKLKKKISRAGSVSGTVNRRKSLGSLRSTTSAQRMQRSPSLGSSAVPSRPESPPPPLPISPTTANRQHIFHLHKHVKPPSNGFSSETDAPGIAITTDENGNPGPPPSHTNTDAQPLASDLTDRRSKRIALLSRLPEPTLSSEQENRKVVDILRRIWLLVAGLYRRGGMFDEAHRAVDEAAKWKTVDGEWEADILAERGYLAMSMNEREAAANHFENALAYDMDHPLATIGLCQIILAIPTNFSTGPQPLPLSATPSNTKNSATATSSTGNFAVSASSSTSNIAYTATTSPIPPSSLSSLANPHNHSPLALKTSNTNLAAHLNPSTAATSAYATPAYSSPSTSHQTPSSKPSHIAHLITRSSTTREPDSASPPSDSDQPSDRTTASPPRPAPIPTTPLSPLTARNRAYGLLTGLTKSGRGWDCSEAWFELARTYEEGGQLERAKEVLWWCVGLEDTKPVRGWGGGGVGSGAEGVGSAKRVL